MLRLSPEQLAVIQSGLVPPLPPMVVPPQMIPPPPPAAAAAAQASSLHDPGGHARAPGGGVPLSLLLPAYVGLAGAAAVALLLPPARDAALLLASPWLSLTVGLHSLAAGHSPPAQGLGLLLAGLHPAAAWLGGVEGALSAALCLSLFLLLSVPPRGGRRAFSALGLGLAVVGGLLALGTGGPGARKPLSLVLTGLALQAAVGAGRLRGAALQVSVGQ
jgi:hypothetical protein